MVTPRDRSNRLRRDEIRIRRSPLGKHVGLDSMEFTCPRCGWPCTHLVPPYYESPWREFGGICSACIQEAVSKFDREGWPPDPREVVEVEAPRETVEALSLDLDQ